MKFGKTIQARQIPGWGPYYLDYKFLKKIINSLASHRPASEASLLALGIRPSSANSPTSSPASPAVHPDVVRAPPSPLGTFPFYNPSSAKVSNAGQVDSAAAGMVSIVGEREGAGAGATSDSDTDMIPDLEPLPPHAVPPGSTMGMNGGSSRSRDSSRDESFKAHRAVFFFKLGREIEKINAFYLTKERDLRLRLLTLLNNRERLLHAIGGPGDIEDSSQLGETSRKGTEWANLEEGWRLFERDLGKLQQFIEINATGFRKILKKWDKRSKSNTKELYLERQVEVQPCFNRECVAKMADIVAANILDLENGANNINMSFLSDLPEALGGDGLHFARNLTLDSSPRVQQTGHITIDSLTDLEFDLEKAIEEKNEAAYTDWLKSAKQCQETHPANIRLMRLVWRAIEQFPAEYLDMELRVLKLDFGFIDHINGRTPLHEACIQGRLDLVKLCISHNVDLEAKDAYERRPLHYAAMHGHPEICAHLLQNGVESTATDMDGYTPLIQAVVSGRLECVEMLVKHAGKTALEPTAISNDLIPLSLACQYGHLDVARLLLRNGAKVLPNSEGLYPQHLAARSGYADICQLLIQEGGPNGGGKDRADKYNAWMPLHYACVGGTEQHFECAKVLVNAGVDVNAVDEYGKSAGFYAGWYGQIACLDFLIKSGARLELAKSGNKTKMLDFGLQGHSLTLSPSSDNEDDGGLDGEIDLIPSLSLPPPIIPLRMYGHDFLAKRSLVQLTLGHPVSEASNEKTVFPVKLYNRSDDGNLLNQWSSLTLVMTSKPDATAIPHSVILPLADEREIFSFQVEDLSKFILELSLYPTFGSKVIGRAIVLPSTFNSINRSKSVVVPLLDQHLKAIGEVSFHVQCIRPFEGAQLEIGGRVETYWKSTTVASQVGTSQDHAHQFQPHRPLSVAATSPSMLSTNSTNNSSSATKKDAKESGFVTASSLAGDYLTLIVQVTRDYVPVIYPSWLLPCEGLYIGVSDVTYEQYCKLGAQHGRSLEDVLPQGAELEAKQWHELLQHAMIDLATALTVLPIDLGVNMEVRYTSESDAEREGIARVLDLNTSVDSVLRTVYDAARNATTRRKIIFSGFDATVCSHIQLKQPNFAVFYSSFCNVSRYSGDRLIQASPQEESLSVREAVKLAKGENMLGVVLDGRLLNALPFLVPSVKDAGLLLIAMGTAQQVTDLRKALGDQVQLDGHMVDGLVKLTA